jgi:hypothetical protein
MPNYATLNELKTWLSIGTADTTDDASLTIALNGAEAAIDRYCSRSFVAAGTVASVRYFEALDVDLVHVTDIGSLTDLAVATDLDFDGQYATVWTATDYQVDPINAIADSRPVTAIRARRAGTQSFPVYGGEKLVKVTARWGWPAVPAEVKQATVLQAARFHSRRRAPLGSIQAPELGGGERLPSRLDPDVQVLVEHLRRSWFGLTL